LRERQCDIFQTKNILSVQSERKSKLIRMHKALNKSAEETREALIKTAESIPKEIFLSLTFDNGAEKSMELKHTSVIRFRLGRKAGWKMRTN